MRPPAVARIRESPDQWWHVAIVHGGDAAVLELSAISPFS